MKTYLLILIFLFNVTATYSQDKLEREYRIKHSQVPATALEYAEHSFPGMRIKWYGEDNLKGKAIEAKGKLHGEMYSIKFDTSGVLMDIEMVINFSTIPESVRMLLEKNLEDRFSKFRVQRTQIQWVGSKTDLAALVNGEKVSGSYSTNYEITLQGTKDRRTDYYEVLSNDRGELIRESKIVQRNNHHLIY
jgi:hypothetical protein